MRLFLLPISTRQSLIYCQKRSRSPGQSTYIDRMTSKASERWLLWETYKSGWQKKVTVYGNKLFQRLPFEEWGLKSVPPLSAKRRAEELEEKLKSTVEYPGTVVESLDVEKMLQNYGSDTRQSYHRKWFWGSVIGMPISAPIALLPVIPNLPFFYLVFRSWSHWRARCGSEHIEFLVENRLLNPTPSSILDEAYAVANVGVSLRNIGREIDGLVKGKREPGNPAVTPQQPAEELLLSQDDGALIAQCLGIPDLGPEVERAVWQVERSVGAGRELAEEKAELDHAKKNT